MNTLFSSKIKVIKANHLWNLMYKDVLEKKEKKEKKISFVNSDMKINIQTYCKCNIKEFSTCDLHDGSDPRKKKFYKMVENYFAQMKLFDEPTLIKYLDGNIELVVFCLEQTKEVVKRLERRKKELFESDIYEFYLKKCLPRLPIMEDFDPKWDNINLNLAAAKKQMKYSKVSLIKGGSRGLDGSLDYNHIPYIKNLQNLLENVYEAMFLEFILI